MRAIACERRRNGGAVPKQEDSFSNAVAQTAWRAIGSDERTLLQRVVKVRRIRSPCDSTKE